MMLSIFFANIFIFLLALVLALLEIQIEGPHGWAKQLPTWRPAQQSRIARAYARLMSGKELTGYHLFLFSFVLLVFHLPFVSGLPWSVEQWLKQLSFFFFFVVIWDFLWFVCNPAYPLKQFRREHVWWHSRWVWALPLDYYVGICFSFFVLFIPVVFFRFPSDLLQWWGMNAVLFFCQTAIVIFFTLKVLRIDHWNERLSL